jgi:hypothetical protein
VALLVLAALAALGLWFDAAGVVGVYLSLLFRGLFGLFGLLAPVALVVGGVMLLGERRPANARVMVGLSAHRSRRGRAVARHRRGSLVRRGSR